MIFQHCDLCYTKRSYHKITHKKATFWASHDTMSQKLDRKTLSAHKGVNYQTKGQGLFYNLDMGV